jgi:hypothetical protein
MNARVRYLRLVEAHREPDQGLPERGDVALVAGLFVLNLVPIACGLLRIGHWGSGTLGLSTAGALLLGRELWSQLRVLVLRRE